MIWQDVKGWFGVAIFTFVLLIASLGIIHYSKEMVKCHRHGGAYIEEGLGYKCILEKK